MNVMMYYIVYVFGMAGLTGNTNLIASSIQYVINVGMTVFALIYIDRWGRRMPLLVGATLMGTFMFGNAGLLAVHGHPAPPGGINGIAEQSWQIEGAPARAVIAFTYLFVGKSGFGHDLPTFPPKEEYIRADGNSFVRSNMGPGVLDLPTRVVSS